MMACLLSWAFDWKKSPSHTWGVKTHVEKSSYWLTDMELKGDKKLFFQ
jgi:hypothetical protein